MSNEPKPPSPDQTQPFRPVSRDPSDTQRLRVEHRPEPSSAEESIPYLIERVRQQDDAFRRKVETALQGAMGNHRVRVLDFRWLEGSTFVFTIDVGGHPQEVIVEQHDGGDEDETA